MFGPGGGGVPVGSTKSAARHMLGAAGAIEAVFSILALRDQLLPPGRNLVEPMAEAAGFDLITAAPRKAQTDRVLLNAFGLGGVNAAHVFCAI